MTYDIKHYAADYRAWQHEYHVQRHNDDTEAWDASDARVLHRLISNMAHTEVIHVGPVVIRAVYSNYHKRWECTVRGQTTTIGYRIERLKDDDAWKGRGDMLGDHRQGVGEVVAFVLANEGESREDVA